tara:strand:- start:4622 stop:5911 length:1290 start_codon:yes stop_codon:yes gene_type:complete
MSFLGAGFGIGVAKGITQRLDAKNIEDDENTRRIKAQIAAGEKEQEDALIQSGLNANVVINAADDYAKANGYYTDPAALPNYLKSYIQSAGLITDVGGTLSIVSDPSGSGTSVYEDAIKRSISSLIVNAASNKNFDRTDPNSVQILLNNPEAFDPRLEPPKKSPPPPTTTVSNRPDGDETVPLFKRMRNFFNPLTDEDILRNIAKTRGMSEDQINKLMTAGMAADDAPTFVSTLEEDVTRSLGGKPLPQATLNYINTILPAETAVDVEKAAEAYLNMDTESLKNAYFKKTTGADGKPLSDDKLFVRDNITDYGQSIDTVMQVYLSNEDYDDKLVNRFDTQRKRLGLPPLNPINKEGVVYGEEFLTEGIGYNKINKKYTLLDLESNTPNPVSDTDLRSMIRARIASSEPNLSEEDLQIKIRQAITKIQNG